MPRIAVMILLAVLIPLRGAYAQNEVNNLESLANIENAMVSGEEGENVSITKEGNVSFDFREADIRNVLQILSLKSGINIVPSPEVAGTVTIQLKDVPWQQALDVILQTYGYASDRRGNIIVVTTVENLKKRREDAQLLTEQEPLETRTFTLNFGKASEIIESIQKMKSERGSIDFDERTNTLIITETSKKLDLIDDVVKKLDRTTPQVLIESKLVKTRLNNTETLGIDWTAKASVGGSARNTTYPFTDHSENKYLNDNNFPASTTGFTYGTINFSTMQATMQMLKTRDDTKLISNPRIVTLDNRPAKIIVADQFPIPTYTYNEQQARLQVSGWEYKDIGTIFLVTPHVNSAGFVTLDIEPEVSVQSGTVTFESTSLPLISKQSTKTSVMIKDNDTLIIAGLIKDEVTKNTKKKVPILGDIPIIGLAFQNKDFAGDKQDLLIFITPHIITLEIPAAPSS